MKKRIIQIFLLLAVFTALADEPSIKVKVESESRFVYEPFSLRVDVTCEKDPERPVVADGSGYTVSSISYGRKLSNRQKGITSFRVEIVADQPGVITIAPVEVEVGGSTLKSTPLRLFVDEPHRAEGCELNVGFSTTNLYVDQAVEMVVTWRSQASFIQYQELVLDLPILRDTGLAIYPLDPDVPENKRIGLPVNEQRVIAEKFNESGVDGLRFKYMLVPLKAGVYGSERMQLTCALMKDKQNSNQYPSYFNNNFFAHPDSASRFERVYQTAPVSHLHVSALPDEGRSPLYCGVAGSLKASATVNPREMVVGQPMMFEVELSDMVFGRRIQALPAAVLANIGPSFKLTAEPIRESATPHGHKFVYALRALRCDATFVPALAMQVFDPESGVYRMVRTASIDIKVEPDGEKDTYVPADTGIENILVPLSGIRSNRKQSGALMNGYDFLSFVGERAWLFWLLAPVVWLCIRGWIRRLERCRVDPEYARAVGAMRAFKRAVHNNEELALRNYLADRFGMCAGAITAESCVEELRKRGVPRDVVETCRAYFNSLDSEKYSPAGTSASGTVKVSRLVKAVERVSALLLAVLLLVPVSLHASDPDERFNAAMELRTNRPDEARPLFVDAALGYEDECAFFNAGNSWFFAGESGRALAAYLSAESRAPFNRAIRDSIKFLRTQRQDNFNEKPGMISGIFSLWRSLCRWDVRLRLGVLTLLYLAGWFIYLLYRVYGWKPGRRACGVYAGVMILIALTLLYSAWQPGRGVIVQSAGARLGPGYAYEPAYKGVLSPAVEFEWLGSERGWVRARLPDKSEVWVHNSTCVRVR